MKKAANNNTFKAAAKETFKEQARKITQKAPLALNVGQMPVISDDPVTNPLDLKKYKATDLLPREFYLQDVVTLAQELLGKVLVRETKDGVIKCMIVETEAYKAPHDRGCHAFNNKRTERTKYFWLEGGHLYAYTIYGMNVCINVVAGRENEPEAVLIRAVEPVQGLDIIQKNRNIKGKKNKELTGGPAKLTKGLDITMALVGIDLRKRNGELYIEKGEERKFEVVRGPRINIDYAEDWIAKPWRFYIKGNPYVSV